MRSHPKKRQVVQPDAAPRGDSSYTFCGDLSLTTWPLMSFNAKSNSETVNFHVQNIKVLCFTFRKLLFLQWPYQHLHYPILHLNILLHLHRVHANSTGQNEPQSSQPFYKYEYSTILRLSPASTIPDQKIESYKRLCFLLLTVSS